MRLFVAVYPPPEALDDIAAQAHRLRVGEVAATGVNVRLAPRSSLHVTVVFLGEVDDDRLPTVEEALGRAVRRWHPAAGADQSGPPADGGEEAGPPRLRLGGGGRFGRGRFTLLWVGLTGDTGALDRLAGATRQELRRSRIPHDRRPFRPHLTLARPGDRVDRESVEEDVRTLDGYLGPSWPATEMVLVRSHLGPRPTYDRLAAWPLGPGVTGSRPG
ncbi:2'-5' RNA ligase family protein [Plantactinospora sp. CA-290183]|uniref:2'-5' RNA ligase family protein n=1 Tax=Plantactinospora sp. CA-290183 TaxID=3240006 RepID=UPI003D9489E7